MKKKKNIITHIYASQKETQPWLIDEYKPVVDFFSLLMEWDQNENVSKGYTNEKQNQRNSDNSY